MLSIDLTVRRTLVVAVLLLAMAGFGFRYVNRAVASTAHHLPQAGSTAPTARPVDSTGSVARVKSLVKTRIPTNKHLDSHPFIDGSQTPELIPTNVAYSFFLRALMAGDTSSRSPRRQRAYVKHVLGITSVVVRPAKGDLRPHVLSRHAKEPEVDVQANRIIAFVSTYEASLASFDARGGKLVEEVPLIDKIIGSMSGHLGEALTSRLDSYVKHHVKRQIKIIGRTTT